MREATNRSGISAGRQPLWLSALPLSDTTWVLCTRRPARVVLQSLAAALDALRGDAVRTGLLLHAQRAPRGASADECLLQGLVRCRATLPAVRPRGEVLDVSRSGGR